MLKRLDLQRQSWKQLGFLSLPPSQVWPAWQPIGHRSTSRGPRKLHVPAVSRDHVWTRRWVRPGWRTAFPAPQACSAYQTVGRHQVHLYWRQHKHTQAFSLWRGSMDGFRSRCSRAFLPWRPHLPPPQPSTGMERTPHPRISCERRRTGQTGTSGGNFFFFPGGNFFSGL